MEQTNYTHITQFKIEIDNKTFNSLADLNTYVAGIMMQNEEMIPANLNAFLFEYAQLNGVIKIGEPEPDNPMQYWFRFPNDSKVYDVVCFTVRGGDIMLHYTEPSDEIEPVEKTLEELLDEMKTDPIDIKMVKIF